MESLESKLDLLSPVQRREVEDFVDFLLYRSGFPPRAPLPVTVNPPVLNFSPPVIPVMTPMRYMESPQFVMHEQNIQQDEPYRPSASEASSPVIQEITVEVDDRISRDYMDYGQFEQQDSPATAAVKKVKAKLIQKSEQDKSNHLLDWVD